MTDKMFDNNEELNSTPEINEGEEKTENFVPHIETEEITESTENSKVNTEVKEQSSAPSENAGGFSYTYGQSVEATPEAPSQEQTPESTREASNNSGEYRYKPPYAAYGANYQPPRSTVGATPDLGSDGGNVPPQPSQPKKIVSRSFSTGAMAMLLVACILLSFGAGFGGAYMALSVSGNENTGVVVDGDAEDKNEDALIIYKSAMVTDEKGNSITTNLSVPAVEEIVSDSVVEITTEIQSSYGPYQFVSEGAGSGVIISENGYVITNNHVIVDSSNNIADTIIVRLTDGTEYEAEAVGTDSESDIALLKIDAKDLHAAIVGDSDKLVVGESIVAVGNPLGELGGTVTTGIVSATGRSINVDGNEMKLIQIDAAVNPGNSGGGLFNLRGELVGIVNAKSTGEGVEGLGFAIPVNDAINVSEQIKTNGYVTGRTYIGVSFLDVTDEFTAYRYFGSATLGVYVYQTLEGYNDNALKSGDRIIAVNEEEITSSNDIKSIVKEHEVGDTLKFTLYRDGKLKEVEVKCHEYVPEDVKK